jgi:CheY-like chemotaxis protein
MRYKVLWVEDNAESDLFHFLAPVNVDGRFDMDIAVNATEACTRLQAEAYDVVIMDSRIPSGHADDWKIRETRIQQRSPIVRLGLEILKIILKEEEKPPILSENRKVDKYCVFSIDPKTELTTGENADLVAFDYERKTTSMPRNILVQIIEKSLRRQNKLTL